MATNANANDARKWLLAQEAAVIAELSMRTIVRLGKAGVIGVRRIPGARVHYSRSDVEQLSTNFFFPATRPSVAGGPPTHEEHLAAPFAESAARPAYAGGTPAHETRLAADP
jgi:hypothetical protein